MMKVFNRKYPFCVLCLYSYYLKAEKLKELNKICFAISSKNNKINFEILFVGV